jgi:hypothetical protein
MTPEELDDYLERVRAENASVAVPAQFTDRVMRAVQTPAPAPRRLDLLSSSVASGALVGSGAVLWASGDAASAIAAVALVLFGLAWMWMDDPFDSEMKIRLSPW